MAYLVPITWPGPVGGMGRGHSFCQVGTDPSVWPTSGAGAEASGLWLELHGSDPSGNSAFYGKGQRHLRVGPCLPVLSGEAAPACYPGRMLPRMHLKLGFSYKASLQLGFQSLEETFSAPSAFPLSGSSRNTLSKTMELIRGGAWL